MSKILVLLALLSLAGFPGRATAGIMLGMAGDFSVLAGSTVTNTGSTIINGGDVGVSSESSITGFPGGILMAPYSFHTGDAIATQAHNDLTTAYTNAAAMISTQNLTGQDLGGLTLTPGVYFFASSAQLTGTLTLNDQGNPNAQFVFQIGSTLTSMSGSSVVTINSGSTATNQVFWQVGSSATLGTDSAFEGQILAYASITLTTGATILDGSALTMTGAVTLDSNLITDSSVLSSVPEPSSVVLVLIGGTLAGLPRLRTGRRKSGR